MTYCRARVFASLPLFSLLALGCSSGDAKLDAAAAGSTGAAGVAGAAGADAGAAGVAGAEAGAAGADAGAAGAAGSMAGAAGGDAGAAGAGTTDASAAGSGTGDDGGASDATAATGCGKDLSGTWDLIGQKPGSKSDKAVMVIGPDVFSLTMVNPTSTPGQLAYSATPIKQVTFQNEHASTLSVENTTTALDAGSLPLALGGTWKFTGKSGFCTASVAAGLVSGHCTSSQLDMMVGGGEWPGKVPALLYNVDYAATRTATSASNFGELGGVWTASPAGAAKGCTIKVEGRKLTADCTTARFAGHTELTISDECVASGVNGDGYELSGRRR